MRILHIIPSMAGSYGGPSHALALWQRFLQDYGIKSTIVTTSIKEEGPLCLKTGNVVLLQRDFPRAYYYSRSLSEWLRRHIEQYDIVHIHSAFSYPSMIAAYWARRAGIPYIVRPFGTLDRICMKNHCGRKKIYFEFIEKRNLGGARFIHCTSEMESNEIKRFNVDWKEKIRIIPPGILPEEYDGAAGGQDLCGPGPENRKKKILFMSRLHRSKGLDQLIAAAGILLKDSDNFLFLIAGSGEKRYESHIKNMVERNGLQEAVFLLGAVYGDAKARLLTAADAYILPSHHESFGLAVVEAMAAGCPVMVSEHVAIYPEIEKYGAGTVFRLDAGDIAATINLLLKNEDLREKMARNARILAREKYDIRKSACLLASMYKECGNLKTASV